MGGALLKGYLMFPRARLGGGNSALAWTIAGWIVFTAASVNTLLFVLLYTNPIIVADDWYFLSAFLRPALEGNLEFSDFFVYRGSGDHVQPLHKAILLMELNWFNLDYTPSAVIGVFSGAACSLILAWVLRHCCEGKVPEHIKFFAWALATATLFSLNTTGSWRWPLAAMGHLTSALSFFLIAFTWSEL
jgi:hypothetical protein